MNNLPKLTEKYKGIFPPNAFRDLLRDRHDGEPFYWSLCYCQQCARQKIKRARKILTKSKTNLHK